MILRTCTACREPWPLECFAKGYATRDGRCGQCKACIAERRRELAAGAPRRRPWGAPGRRFVGTRAERARDRARKARARP